ncbi:glutaredoxin [Candidozyma auris]
MFSSFKRLFFTSSPRMVSDATKTKVNQLISEHPVMIFSKDYCPYCSRTKQTISSLTDQFYVLELNTIPDGSEIQDYLEEISNQRTVPNVYINGKHVGGNSDVQALNSQGKLSTMLKAAL